MSTPLDDPQDVSFKTNKNFAYFTNHVKIAQIDTEIDEVSFSDYLVQDSGALFGFDKENNELVITNDYFSYSCVFSFDSG
ncbi:MAG: hypothetical protein K9J13_17485, partial [Saprospiraceae bacterium]|nr:hypothetical protein [Saprospiraceae bacterium]